jgi:peptide/nickel transport system permease protein
MIEYLVRRALVSLLLLWIVSMIGFLILHLAPGGPLAQFTMTAGVSQEQLAKIAEQMGLNQPLPIQYWNWLTRVLAGDWGTSYRDGQGVGAVIASRFGATLLLMLTATTMAILVGAAIGILGAIRQYSVFDYLATIGAMIALSIPTFWFGLIAIYVFALKLDWFPSGNIATPGLPFSFADMLSHLVLPACVLGLVMIAIWSRYMRSSMLEVIHQDYIRTARAKGLSESRILWSHALRNALLPMITLTGLQVPALLGGALVTETVFTWPGMGRLFLDSLSYRDYPVVMGILMFSAVLTLVGNLIADILYTVQDPRVRLG